MKCKMVKEEIKKIIDDALKKGIIPDDGYTGEAKVLEQIEKVIRR